MPIEIKKKKKDQMIIDTLEEEEIRLTVLIE